MLNATPEYHSKTTMNDNYSYYSNQIVPSYRAYHLRFRVSFSRGVKSVFRPGQVWLRFRIVKIILEKDKNQRDNLSFNVVGIMKKLEEFQPILWKKKNSDINIDCYVDDVDRCGTAKTYEMKNWRFEQRPFVGVKHKMV